MKDKPEDRGVGSMPSENVDTVTQAATEEDVGLGKRIFVDLNSTSWELNSQKFRKHILALGGTVLAISNFGVADGDVSRLMKVENLLREGRVIWLRVLITEQHTANAKWIAQCCRTAHRAGIPWWIRLCLKDPWQVPPLKMLKKLSYVCV